MAAEVRPLPNLKLATGPSPITAEQRYWKSFKSQKSHTSTASWPVTHISYPSTLTGSSLSASSTTATRNNDFFAVTSGPRVDVFSIRKREPVKTIGRFDREARSAEIRQDSRVLVAGDDSGKMQVFDVAATGGRAAVLKTWHEHKDRVWVTKWSPTELTTLMSASDDKTVRLWDLPGQESVRKFVGHQDYVRSGAFMPGGSHAGGNGTNMLVTGSYDATVRLWDSRVPTASGAVLTFKHAAPVEQVLPLPGGTTVLAASDNSISVLDLVAARPSKIITNHQKTVTSLCLASNGTRVVSGGLDGHVKIFETGTWNVVAGAKYPSPILSVAVIASGANAVDRHLAVGMQSGVLSIRTRLTGQIADRERADKKTMAAATADDHHTALARLDTTALKRKRKEDLHKALNTTLPDIDFVIPDTSLVPGSNRRKKKAKLPLWQEHLRQQRFSPALDAALDKTQKGYSPLAILTLLTALRHRSAIRDALVGRDEITVLPVLRWIALRIVDPRYRSVCVDVGLHLLDLYSEFCVGEAAQEVTEGFRKLRKRVEREVERAQVAACTGGMLEGLLLGSML